MRKKIIRTIALTLVFDMVFQILFPVYAMALTGGPTSPEFSTFTPVATTDMVSPFSGAFNYNLPILNVPGPHGGGYSMSLSYNSGVTSEQEASWVGFGWNLNPGQINRDVKGFPDEYNNAVVLNYNKNRPNWTAAATENSGFSFGPVGISGFTSVRYNNYMGLAKSIGLGLDFAGIGLSIEKSETGVTFAANVNPVATFRTIKKARDTAKKKAEAKLNPPVVEVKEQSNAEKLKDFKDRNNLKNTAKEQGFSMLGSAYEIRTNAIEGYPGIQSAYEGNSISANANVRVTPSQTPAGITTGKTVLFSYQKSTPFTSILACGAFYNNQNNDIDNSVTDYYTEKATGFEKRDLFLGIPFNAEDNFNVMCEGLSGGFRYYNEKTGTHKLNKVKGGIGNFNIGLSGVVGLDIGVGLSIGGGKNNVELESKWVDGSEGAKPNFGDFDKGVFRFMSDKSGEINYSNNKLTYAKLSNNKVDYNGIAKSLNKSKAKSSSHIQYKSGEIKITNQDGMKYKFGEKLNVKNETNIQVNANELGLGTNLTATDGDLIRKNVYLSKDNGNYSMNLDNDKHYMVVGDIKNIPYASTFLLSDITTTDYIDLTDNGVSEDDLGGWTKFQYTQIFGDQKWYRYRSPFVGLNYNKNQISDYKDDVGSFSTGEKEVKYLKTIETKTHIALFVTNKTDASRLNQVPVIANLPSTIKDEVIAKYTGSGNERLDGLSAPDLGANRNDTDPAATGSISKSNLSQLEFLEKIILISKNRPEKPLQTINFSYDYSICKGLPNSKSDPAVNDFQNPAVNGYYKSGKLTLKKVWVEYEGVYNARISPYIFDYSYPKTLSDGFKNNPKYKNILDFNQNYTEASENPDYNPFVLDAWGNVQPYGETLNKFNFPFRYQGPMVLPYITNVDDWRSQFKNDDKAAIAKNFDPAAWSLKAISLPSGGKILVQYEQNEYTHVQDRPAMSLNNLEKYEEVDMNGEKCGKATLDLSYYGLTSSYITNSSELQARINALKQKIEEYYVGTSNKIYFKFLYNLVTGSKPPINDCASEYISGYSEVKDVQFDATTSKIHVILKPAEKGQVKLPSSLCRQYLKTQKPSFRKTATTGKCACGEHASLYEDIDRDVSNQTNDQIDAFDAFSIFGALNFEKGSSALSQILETIIDNETYCKTINSAYSYLRIPMPHPKKGAGIRVKRLLMYDRGIENGQETLYGSEYFYENQDGSCSGVATNEPVSNREENPLVQPLPRKEQSWFSRMTAGEDMKQSEGPIGENMLPSSSVGYGRIVVQNIHTGKSSVGFSINEFYTSKEFPYDRTYLAVTSDPDAKTDFEDAQPGVSFTSVTDMPDHRMERDIKIPAGIFNYDEIKIWATQGYNFIVSNMHGVPKSNSTYGGVYIPKDVNNSSVPYIGLKDGFLVSQEAFEYFNIGEKVKLCHPSLFGGEGKLYEYGIPGKENEVAIEEKSITDKSFYLGIDLEITIGVILPPPVFPIVIPNFSMTNNRISTHSVSNITRYPTILKKVTQYKDGISTSTENIAFDKYTGNPVITKTYDSYHNVPLPSTTKHSGDIYNIMVPAYWKYSEMGPKSDDNPSYSNQLSAQMASFSTYNLGKNPITKKDLSPLDFTNGIIPNVLSASVQSFKKDWDWSNSIASEYELTSATTGAKNKFKSVYRPYKSYVFKDNVTDISTNKIYNTGYYTITGHNWYNINPEESPQSNWIKQNEVLSYSPNGQPTGDRNRDGIANAARYDKDYGFVKIMGSNAEYDNIYFDDFEKEISKSSNNAHSGTKSFDLSKNSGSYSINSILLSVNSKGSLLRLWYLGNDVPRMSPNQSMNLVSQSGDWKLYEAYLNSSAFAIAGTGLIDDVRVQPTNSSATCYVYDLKSFRLLTQFDDKHYGMFYEYNDEGKLIRKKVETERGVKTIQETQYNNQKINKN